MKQPARLASILQPSVEPAIETGPNLRAGLLDRLPEGEAEQLLAAARRIHLAPRQVLCHGDLPMEHVYFIESGLVSVMAKADKNRWVEAWMVGSGRLVGLPPLLAGGHSANRQVVQIGGAALCMPSREFQRLLDGSRHLRAITLEHLAYLLLQASQIAACNAQHSAIERVARWLLLAWQELREKRISVSHDALARALGLRRATVSDSLKQLETWGAIKTDRRLIEITDANILHARSCDCYRIITRGRARQAPTA